MTSVDKKPLSLEFCPNYDHIVGYDYNADDMISKYLIDSYRDYVFTVNTEIEEEVNMLKTFDKAINEYINNADFFKKVQDHFHDLKIGAMYFDEQIVEINNLYNKYQDDLLKDIANSRWV